jgi:hypothetical protein
VCHGPLRELPEPFDLHSDPIECHTETCPHPRSQGASVPCNPGVPTGQLRLPFEIATDFTQPTVTGSARDRPTTPAFSTGNAH